MNNANGQGGSTFGWLRKEALLFVNKKKQKNFFIFWLVAVAAALPWRRERRWIASLRSQ